VYILFFGKKERKGNEYIKAESSFVGWIPKRLKASSQIFYTFDTFHESIRPHNAVLISLYCAFLIGFQTISPTNQLAEIVVLGFGKGCHWLTFPLQKMAGASISPPKSLPSQVGS